MNLKVPQSREFFDLVSNYQLFKKYHHHVDRLVSVRFEVLKAITEDYGFP
jgi:predicted site-specific integrase-resolvase